MKQNTIDLQAYIRINGGLPKSKEDLDWWFQTISEKYAPQTKEEIGWEDLMEEEVME